MLETNTNTPEFKSLIKNLDNLAVIVGLYLIITWGYQGLSFIANGVSTLFS